MPKLDAASKSRITLRSRSDLVYGIFGLILFGITAVRLAQTYTTFTQTYDEPFHIACGMEWLDKGTYNCEWQHPPLARVAMAIGPYLKGRRSHFWTNAIGESNETITAEDRAIREGNEILASDGHYWQNLKAARFGNLPFLFLACAVILLWARRWFTTAGGIWAVLLFLSLPPILGHAALATLDLACAAGVLTALYQFMCWLEEPSWRHSLGLALAISIAFLVKFSSIGFLAVCSGAAVLLFLLSRPKATPLHRHLQLRSRIGQALVIVCAVFVLLWVAYRFSLDPVSDKVGFHPSIDRFFGKGSFLSKAGYKALEQPVPLAKMVRGIEQVYLHNKEGHDSFLLGTYSTKGWWYFFPVVVGVKTPISFLILAICGLFLVLRWCRTSPWQQCSTAVFPIAILLFCMASGINLGVRHILSIYPFLALVAGYAVGAAMRDYHRIVRGAAVLLVALAVVEGWRAHPDYLAYFNQFAGSHPERILVESDLDWGQDLNRLSLRLKSLGVQRVAIGYFGTAQLENANLPEYRTLSPTETVTGYVAVSVRFLTLDYAKNGAYRWLKDYTPLERIGKSIYLYRIDR